MASTSAAHEEAAYIASEFVYSIDNLPSEVSHLLLEIQHRETRTQELQQEIDKESSRYIRHSLRLSSPSSGASSSSSSSSSSSKLIAIPGKISAAYAEIDELCNEKEEIAKRIVALVERTRTRLDIELGKVRAIQGEPHEYPGMPKPLVGVPSAVDSMKMPVLAMTESLKAALAGTPIVDTRFSSPSQPATPVAATPGGPSHKRRKVTATASTPSIKVPAGAWGPKRSESPTVQPTASTAGNQRSRLSRQIHPVTPDEDEMEQEGEVEEDGDDDRAYCYCQKSSFGEMIACDGIGCPYEWFHYNCVGIKAGSPLPSKFYCDHCLAKKAEKESGPGSTRKGRRK